jgi:two-component system LytT family response regulator
MPKEDGFAFLRSIPSNNYGIIFATAYQEHALRALKANAVDYLMKPINPFELQEAVKKAIYNHELRHSYSEIQEVYNQSLTNLNDHVQSKNNMVTKLTIPEQMGFRLVNVADLMYLQADDNYTVLYLTGDQKIIATRTLGEFEKILEGPEFFRIHKSTIINLNFLVGYSNFQGNFAELKNGSRLDISRRKLPEFREKVKRYSISID